MEKKLSHLDKDGMPGMVDVSDKKITSRIASASGRIKIDASVMELLAKDGFHTKKGSIAQIAVIAGTMAVKNTYNTIPLCHQIPISSCKIFIEPNEEGFTINCIVKTNSQTGVEMEALHGVTTASLTIYDMCKALSHDMEILDVRLDRKEGGKQDFVR
ncbi:MAG: cyclic pyranopterin monophosphate synthase MoaC [Saprospiraceae bacterium]|nr:cyclic pyranopterin monophosphate synthase MoaC [Saprospiraceae bacterium]